MAQNNDTKKTTATPKRPKPVTPVLSKPRAARHAGLNMTALRARRAKNKAAAKSRRINRAR